MLQAVSPLLRIYGAPLPDLPAPALHFWCARQEKALQTFLLPAQQAHIQHFKSEGPALRARASRLLARRLLFQALSGHGNLPELDRDALGRPVLPGWALAFSHSGSAAFCALYRHEAPAPLLGLDAEALTAPPPALRAFSAAEIRSAGSAGAGRGSPELVPPEPGCNETQHPALRQAVLQGAALHNAVLSDAEFQAAALRTTEPEAGAVRARQRHSGPFQTREAHDEQFRARQAATLLRRWTIKEAQLKALGLGLARDPACLPTGPASARCGRSALETVLYWRVLPCPGHWLCVALSAPLPAIELHWQRAPVP